MSDAGSGGRPGRYQRSFGGLIGAMVLLLVVVGAFVAWRGLLRDNPEYAPISFDYLGLVEQVQDAGVEVAYPADLPDGWVAKESRFTPGDRPELTLALETADGRFAGVYDGYAGPDEALAANLNGDPVAGEAIDAATDVAPTWDTWTTADGDTAYVAEVGSGRATRTVMVYGSAPAEELQDLLDRLTTGPVPDEESGTG